MNKRTKIATAAVASVAAVGAGLGVGQAMADPKPTPHPNANQSAGDAPPAHRGPRDGQGPRHDGPRLDVATLAKKLGVKEATLRAALDDVRAGEKPARPTSRPKPPTQAERQAREAAFAKALAKKLKLDEATVAKALAEVRDARQADAKAHLAERLAQAVKDGTLTQAEADAVTKAADAHVIGYGPR